MGFAHRTERAAIPFPSGPALRQPAAQAGTFQGAAGTRLGGGKVFLHYVVITKTDFVRNVTRAISETATTADIPACSGFSDPRRQSFGCRME